MTEQKPHKWQKEIVAWAGGARVEQRFGVCPWEIVDEGVTPAWDNTDYEFRLHDPYREVAEAMKRGELCQYRFGNEWFDATGTLSDYSGCWDDREWRIAPKPDPYQHLRDAIRAGKQIEFYSELTGTGRWVSIGTADDHNQDRTFHLPPDRYRIAKPEPKEEELYVLVSEPYGHKEVIGNRPIFWDLAVNQSVAPLEDIKEMQSRLGGRYGKTRIAKIQFIDEDAKP